jgi:hypothetical protein
VLDPANYGALTITGPVTIEGHGWASLAAVSRGAAIQINANLGDKINIIGVVLDGINIESTTGILFNSGGSLTVRDSVIRNFGSAGIIFGPNTSNPASLYVSNTFANRERLANDAAKLIAGDQSANKDSPTPVSHLIYSAGESNA